MAALESRSRGAAAAALPARRSTGADASRAPLGVTLRARTEDAHLAAERAMDLQSRLASVGRYTGLLELMEAFHRACEPALADVIDRGPAALRDGPARRRSRLLADLEQLGARPSDGSPGSAPALATADHRLGAWYVLEGSALGGLVVAAEVRRQLPAAAPATRYFRGEGRGTAARWRTFQGMLAAHDADGDGADRAVQGALATFAELTDRLEAA